MWCDLLRPCGQDREGDCKVACKVRQDSRQQIRQKEARDDVRELARQYRTFFRVLCLFVSRQLAGGHALCVELRAYTDGLRQRKEKAALMSMSSSPAASSSTRHLWTTASVAYAVASSWEARTTASGSACHFGFFAKMVNGALSMATNAREIKGAPHGGVVGLCVGQA